MKSSAVLPIAGLALAFLSGCAAPHWQKPGATPAQLQSDQAACAAQAQAKVPPHMVTSVVSGGSFSAGASQCGNPGNTDSSQCYSTPNQFQGPTYTQKDTNAGARDAAASQCLISRGYSQGN